MRIHELAAATGVSARSLRYYEAQGLLKPRRSQNGYRQYSEDDVVIVDRIRWLLAAGVATVRIREVLPCFLVEHPGKIECPNLRKQLMEEVERIKEQIANLQQSHILLRSALEGRDKSRPRRAF